MYPKIISVIPARGGSKGIPKKNILLLQNKPLVSYSIEQSLNSKLIAETYVSTEDNEIKNISLLSGAKIIDRPKKFATDIASTELVLLHAAEFLNHDFDYMVLLQPTSPLRYPEQIDEAIKKLIDQKGDSLLSVYENNKFLWELSGKSINYDSKNRPRRQEKKWELVENGSIYITKKELLLEERNRLGGKIITYEMPKWMSFEVDDKFDFELIEYLIKNKLDKKKFYLKDIIRKIKLVIFDVDGVFTDGSVYLNKDGSELMKFSRIDGKGIELLRNAGFKTAVITSENSEIVQIRMNKLMIDDIFINIKKKLAVFNILKEKYSLEHQNICYLGDDIQDLEILKIVGFSCCPSNAQQIVKENSIYISPFQGGDGFVRDVCNLILNYKSQDNQDSS